MNTHVAVVIGAGGLGLAIARRIGSGRTLLLADFNQSALDAAARAFTYEGFDIVTRQVDVSVEADVAALASQAAQIGVVTTVVHAAGIAWINQTYQRVLDVNLLGTAIVLEQFCNVISPGGVGLVGYRQLGWALVRTPPTGC